MKERTGLVTLMENPVTLVGDEINVGDKAPNFTVVDNKLDPVEFSSFRGKTCIISSVPSLDTPVCDTSTRAFNQEAAGLGPDIVILTISMDLPFAQSRWCGAAGVDAVQTLSDHKEASFGTAFGVLIKELRLLARAQFVVDKEGVVRYARIIPEVAQEPDLQPVIKAAKEIV